MKLPGKLPIDTIRAKLPNLTENQSIQLVDSINVAPLNVVAINVQRFTSGNTDKTFSMRFKKWIEPYEISGVRYSLFYTEVDHNYKVGDRVFIEGGVYDSDAFISRNNNNKGTDGYKVLYVDRCKIVLDIKYTGDLPTNEEEIDNFVKVYTANTQEEFEYYCQVLTMRQDSNPSIGLTGSIHSKFDIGFNNFLFLNGTFSITPTNYQLTSFASDLALTSTSPNLGNSFVIRGTTGPGTYFFDITQDVLSNSIVPYLNIGWTQSLSGFFNVRKLRIMSGNFIIGGVEFKTDYIYYFDVNDNKWKIDKTYLPTIITEQHFRRGIFKKGEYSQGLYGQHEERIKYQGDFIKWNLGSTLNVDWLSGVMDSTIYKAESWFTIFDRTGLPQIRANAPNNGGAGYNYVFNTNFTGGDIINGNIFNMKVIYGTNSTTSVLENYLTGQSVTYSITISGGVYYNSDILFANVSNSTMISSYVYNSFLTKCKAVNSEIEASVFLDSVWLSDKIVKIQEYEESNIVWYDKTGPVNYKMYKFYLNDTNWLRLREFQNFYFQDLIINIPSDELLNFFDDKFSSRAYKQSFDVVGSKSERKVLIQLSTKEENRNSPANILTSGTVSLQPNDVALPSIDLFIEDGQDFDYGTSSSYPRPFLGDTIDITNAYIIDSDFISGLFKNSKWISGNYINYNKDYHFEANNGYYTASVTASTAQLTLNIGNQLRHATLDTTSASNIAWVSGLFYDSKLNGGSNLVKLPDTYKIEGFDTGRRIYLRDISTQSIYNSLSNFTNNPFLTTKNAQNKYNYLHPVKFEDSILQSGIFRRAYFKNCTIDSIEFDKTDRDLVDFENKRKMLLSDILFSGNRNSLKSGLIQYSNIISGSDDFNGPIIHNSFWNTETFTYSLNPTSSAIFLSGNNSFRNGIFRTSVWENGIFDNGLFYNNKSNDVGTSSVFSDVEELYFMDEIFDRFSWKNGVFNNGDFELSNFEYGHFVNGNFFNSDFIKGLGTGGNFGKSNIPYAKSRVWTGTFSGLNVINAEFRSSDPQGGFNSPTPKFTIEWLNGVFNNGLFGVDIRQTYDQNYPFISNWRDGIFNNGQFTDTAKWYNGTFNNGKFTSFYGMFDAPNKYLTPYEYSLTGSSIYAWENGKFNAGEFGRGLTARNSTWYSGEFNGGIFKGRLWRNGVFTAGQFLGHASPPFYNTYGSNYSNNYNQFYLSYYRYYYGAWLDGFVTKNIDEYVKDEKIYTKIERNSTARRSSPVVNFNNMLWYSGTFSNFDGIMNNSLWLNGTFRSGNFANSAFNPYLNMALPQNIIDATANQLFVNYDGLLILNSTTPKSFNFSDKFDSSRTYHIQFQLLTNVNGTIEVGGIDRVVPNTSVPKIIEFDYTTLPNENTISFTYSGQMNIDNIVIYPGTQSGFRTTDSCIWENGQAFSSDFYFSKWKSGIFDSYSKSPQGNAWGTIWQDGIVKYMNAYNVFWENGIWKNGNWNGNPFHETISTNNLFFVYPGFASDIMNNIYTYGSQSYNLGANPIYSNYDTIFINHAFQTSPNPLSNRFGKGKITIKLVNQPLPTQGIAIVFLSPTGPAGFSWAFADPVTDPNFETQIGNTIIETVTNMLDYINNQTAQPNPLSVFDLSVNGDELTFETKIETTIYNIPSNFSMIDANGLAQLIFGAQSTINYYMISEVSTQIIPDPYIQQNFPNPNNFYIAPNWIRNVNPMVTWRPSNLSTTPIPLSVYPTTSFTPSSLATNFNNSPLYASASGTTNIFTDTTLFYDIEIGWFGIWNNSSVPPSSTPNCPTPLAGVSGAYTDVPVMKLQIGVGYTDNFNNGGFLDTIIFTMSSPVIYGNGSMSSTGLQTYRAKFKPSKINLAFTQSQAIYINKITSTFSSDPYQLHIYKLSINEYVADYDPFYNNDITSFTSSSVLNSPIELPQFTYQLGDVKTKFGNAQFLAGIWENGIWNDGWREDLNTIWCENLEQFSTSGNPRNHAYQENIWEWTFRLKVIDQASSNSPGLLWDPISGDKYFEKGDKVSIGNLVAIDINDNRRLHRGYYEIIDIDYDLGLLDFSLIVNFPIRNIQRDSDEHLIYITKNVWLNGAFLNGVFKDSVWGNGLFQGFPYITKMENSHFIDGKFYGGRFKALSDSYFKQDNLGNLVPVTYHQGVIQKFKFWDANVSGEPYKFKFNSWIDVNYYTTEGVNINKYNKIYSQTGFGYTISHVENNFYGYPTKDVLESESTLRNGFNLNSRKYSLGWKWKEYTNYLEIGGTFEEINRWTYVNSENLPSNHTGPAIETIDSFLEEGWTFSYLSYDKDGYATASNLISSNWGNDLATNLYLKGGRQSLVTSYPYDSPSNFTIDFYDNVNTREIPKRRYFFIELTAVDLSGVNNKPIVFYNNYPATYSIAANNLLFNNANVTVPLNQTWAYSVVRQREYFFNKQSLQLTVFGGPAWTLRISEMRFIETDMIPFLQIASDCVQYKTLTTWDTTPPTGDGFTIPGQQRFGPGPSRPGTWGYTLPIGETSNRSLDGNLSLYIQQNNIAELPTWDRFYLINNGGDICLSFINSDIVTPYSATALDIEYSSTDLTTVTVGSLPNLPVEISQDEGADFEGEDTIPAIDTLPFYELKLDAQPPTFGNVSGAGLYVVGSVVTIIATPTSNNVFVEWRQGNTVVSNSPSYSFVLNSDTELIAYFAASSNFTEIFTAERKIAGESDNISYFGYTIRGFTQLSRYLQVGVLSTVDKLAFSFPYFDIFSPDDTYIKEKTLTEGAGSKIVDFPIPNTQDSFTLNSTTFDTTPSTHPLRLRAWPPTNRIFYYPISRSGQYKITFQANGSHYVWQSVRTNPTPWVILANFNEITNEITTIDSHQLIFNDSPPTEIFFGGTLEAFFSFKEEFQKSLDAGQNILVYIAYQSNVAYSDLPLDLNTIDFNHPSRYVLCLYDSPLFKVEFLG